MRILFVIKSINYVHWVEQEKKNQIKHWKLFYAMHFNVANVHIVRLLCQWRKNSKSRCCIDVECIAHTNYIFYFFFILFISFGHFCSHCTTNGYIINIVDIVPSDYQSTEVSCWLLCIYLSVITHSMSVQQAKPKSKNKKV